MSHLDTLRIYDQAVQSWASSFLVEGNPINTVVATPDRPYGSLRTGLGPGGKPVTTDEEFRGVLMKNPVVSVTRGNLIPNRAQWLSSPWGPVYFSPSIRKPYIESQYPRAYIIQYQLDLRSRRRTVSNLWQQWFYFKFNTVQRLLIDFGLPWSKKFIDMSLTMGLVDNTDLETGEDARFIRTSASIELSAFMFTAVTDLTADVPDMFQQLAAYPAVKKTQIDLYVSQQSTNSTDPSDPGNQFDSTQRREALETPVNIDVESQ